MKVIIHFPVSDPDKNKLAEKAAKVHAHAVIEYINSHKLPESAVNELFCLMLDNIKGSED